MIIDNYIKEIKDKSVAVIGTGISNNGLIELFSQHDINLCVRDIKSKDDIIKNGTPIYDNVNYILGDEYLSNLDYDIIVRAPSLLPIVPELVCAKNNGSIITSEMELFFKYCPCKIIAITGSDGKTTTSTIIANLLKDAGYNIHLGGNIGKPLLYDLDSIMPEDIVVLELSSFQLHSLNCSPDISVITNISANHLDKHGTMSDYIDSKKNIFVNQKEESIVVLNRNDNQTQFFLECVKSNVRFFSDKFVNNGCFFDTDYLYYNNGFYTEKILNIKDIKLVGKHNILNYMAAFCAVKDYITLDNLRNVAKSFIGVQHRLEIFIVHNEICFIDDSIASSPNRTIAGLNSLNTKPILILGGYDKLIPFDELGKVVCDKAKAVYVSGATAEKIITAIKSSCNYTSELQIRSFTNFRDCVISAANDAEKGDIVLLSPACASFDVFKNFEERGNAFKKIILEWINEKNN